MMLNTTENYAVRSVQPITKARLAALKSYSRLPFGALIDDAVEALWDAYVNDDHHLPDVDCDSLGGST